VACLMVLLGCGARVAPGPAPVGRSTGAAAPAAAASPARDLAVPEPYRPAPRKPPEPRDPTRPWLVERVAPSVGDLYERRLGAPARIAGERLEGPGAAFAESELWEPCVRDFVRARPQPARRALTAALARYQTACAPDGGVALQGVRGLDGRERRGRSDVGFAGTLSAARAEVSLRVASCDGARPPERIAIAADGERWTSPRLVFAQDEHGCEVAELPWTRTLARAVWAAVLATDAAIAFEGGGAGAPDLAITDEMKQHLRAMLEAIEAIDALEEP